MCKAGNCQQVKKTWNSLWTPLNVDDTCKGEVALSHCGHVFHKKCFVEWIQHGKIVRIQNIVKYLCARHVLNNIERGWTSIPLIMDIWDKNDKVKCPICTAPAHREAALISSNLFTSTVPHSGDIQEAIIGDLFAEYGGDVSLRAMRTFQKKWEVMVLPARQARGLYNVDSGTSGDELYAEIQRVGRPPNTVEHANRILASLGKKSDSN